MLIISANNRNSLKYQRVDPLGSKDVGIGKCLVPVYQYFIYLSQKRDEIFVFAKCNGQHQFYIINVDDHYFTIRITKTMIEHFASSKIIF